MTTDSSPINSGGAAAPRAEYTRRLAQRRETAAALAGQERSIGNARLALFVGALVLAWLAWDVHLLSPWWLAVPALAFLALVLAHDRVITKRRQADRSVVFYERGLQRLDHNWAGTGEQGHRFAQEEHPYAADLDLFGRGSLFELLCTVRTRGGEDVLAAWLRAPADPQDVLARQAAVDELRPRIDLREQLTLLGAAVRAGLHPEALAEWAAQPPILRSPAARWAAAACAAASALALIAWATPIGPLPLLPVLIVVAAFGLTFRRRVQAVVRAVELPVHDLALLAHILLRIEQEPFAAPRLVRLRADLDTKGLPPSRQIRRLERLVHLLDARRNQVFALLAPLLLWTTQVAFAIEAWRAECGPSVARWLAAVSDFEALCALAGYAYENPDDPFPDIVADGLHFDGEGLGHPLLPVDRCVRNDVRLGSDLRVLIVSGSNMSGKSTLLRTVGVNTVLALAGAPVRAQRLRLSPLAVGASIRIQDSLQAGSSRFYAEITRLRQLADMARGTPPLLFLLDEILHGTNSHDRRIGAEAVVRSLVARGAIGLVTTHDLALASIADTLAHAVNVHFEDHLEDGRMVFDYRMRLGVVQKSNALALMRAVGLEV